jgi:hypothetical protein
MMLNILSDTLIRTKSSSLEKMTLFSFASGNFKTIYYLLHSIAYSLFILKSPNGALGEKFASHLKK